MLILIPKAFQKETIKQLQNEGKTVIEMMPPLYVLLEEVQEAEQLSLLQSWEDAAGGKP